MIGLTLNRTREMVKDSQKKREQVVKSAACQGFLWNKLHFFPEANIFSPIRPTSTGDFYLAYLPRSTLESIQLEMPIHTIGAVYGKKKKKKEINCQRYTIA